jgi:hypothetical protein
MRTKFAIVLFFLLCGGIFAQQENQREFFLGQILTGAPQEKLEAFRAAARSENLSDYDKCELAEAALEEGMLLGIETEAAAGPARYLCAEAVNFIAWHHWTRALPAVLKYTSLIEGVYRKRPGAKYEYLGAINCLGVMADAQAAQALSLNLILANSRMEFSHDYDGDVMLALIGALTSLGYKASYDALSYVGYLPYPEYVKFAAKQALASLAW